MSNVLLFQMDVIYTLYMGQDVLIFKFVFIIFQSKKYLFATGVRSSIVKRLSMCIKNHLFDQLNIEFWMLLKVSSIFFV